MPALVVSGFLGSGKTTLVRRLLAEAQASGVRVAVVSNEFGELGIDQALMGDSQGAYVELDGGCVCCKLSDELQQTLQMLYEEVNPDRVIVETSGVALPFETQLTFWRPPVSEWVSDDAAVVVVNAGQVHEGRDLDGTFEFQVSSADLLLLNQVDTVPEAALPGIRAVLEAMSPGTPVIACVEGDVPTALLFPPDPDGARARRRAAGAAPRPHSHESFQSEVIDVPAGLTVAEVEALLKGRKALRIKGFVDTAVGPRLVQGVGRRLEVVVPPVEVDPAMLGRVVVIERGAAPAEQHSPHDHGRHEHG